MPTPQGRHSNWLPQRNVAALCSTFDAFDANCATMSKADGVGDAARPRTPNHTYHTPHTAHTTHIPHTSHSTPDSPLILILEHGARQQKVFAALSRSNTSGDDASSSSRVGACHSTCGGRCSCSFLMTEKRSQPL